MKLKQVLILLKLFLKTNIADNSSLTILDYGIISLAAYLHSGHKISFSDSLSQTFPDFGTKLDDSFVILVSYSTIAHYAMISVEKSSCYLRIYRT